MGGMVVGWEHAHDVLAGSAAGGVGQPGCLSDPCNIHECDGETALSGVEPINRIVDLVVGGALLSGMTACQPMEYL